MDFVVIYSHVMCCLITFAWIDINILELDYIHRIFHAENSQFFFK